MYHNLYYDVMLYNTNTGIIVLVPYGKIDQRKDEPW